MAGKATVSIASIVIVALDSVNSAIAVKVDWHTTLRLVAAVVLPRPSEQFEAAEASLIAVVKLEPVAR